MILKYFFLDLTKGANFIVALTEAFKKLSIRVPDILYPDSIHPIELVLAEKFAELMATLKPVVEG